MLVANRLVGRRRQEPQTCQRSTGHSADARSPMGRADMQPCLRALNGYVATVDEPAVDRFGGSPAVGKSGISMWCVCCAWRSSRPMQCLDRQQAAGRRRALIDGGAKRSRLLFFVVDECVRVVNTNCLAIGMLLVHRH